MKLLWRLAKEARGYKWYLIGAGVFLLLLTGVNLGGLGTLIASLASLISFKFFSREYPDRKGTFLKEFTIWNLAFLIVLTAAAFLIRSVVG